MSNLDNFYAIFGDSTNENPKQIKEEIETNSVYSFLWPALLVFLILFFVIIVFLILFIIVKANFYFQI